MGIEVTAPSRIHNLGLFHVTIRGLRERTCERISLITNNYLFTNSDKLSFVMDFCKTCHKPASYRCMCCINTYYCSKNCQKSNCQNWKRHKLESSPIKFKVQELAFVISCPKLNEETGITELEQQMQNHKTEEEDLNTSAQPAKGYSSNLKPISYQCASIHGKGWGVFATRDINCGEIIIEERPVLDDSLHIGLELQFNKLSSIEQQAVISLANVHKECDRLKGIMKTNSFTRGPGSPHEVLCLDSSRLNHSCMPNVDYKFREPYQRVFAVRSIKKGEELCQTYCLLSGDRLRVKKELKHNYRFDCMCALCDMKDEEQRTSIEKYRVRYWELEEIMEDMTNSTPRELLCIVNEIFEVMEKGKISSPLLIYRHAFDGFRFALACGEDEQADHYIKKAYKASLIAFGDTNSTTKNYLFLMKNPDSRYQWLVENSLL